MHACLPPRPRQTTTKVIAEVLQAAFSTDKVVAIAITQVATIKACSPQPRCIKPPAALEVCQATAATEGLYVTCHLPSSSCHRCLACTELLPPSPRASTSRQPHLRRAITTAAEGLHAKFAESSSPPRASTLRPLLPGRAVVA
jgi:hypothetical protein